MIALGVNTSTVDNSIFDCKNKFVSQTFKLYSPYNFSLEQSTYGKVRNQPAEIEPNENIEKTVNVNTNTATYIKQMKLGQAGAKLRKYKNTYTDIVVTPVDGGYKVSSLRQPSGETYKLKTYMIVKKQPSGKWLITEELMQTKEQLFLRYADKK